MIVLLNGPIPASFVYFRPFLITISIIQIEKSKDGVLGTQTAGCMMVGAGVPWSYGDHPSYVCFVNDRRLRKMKNVNKLLLLLALPHNESSYHLTSHEKGKEVVHCCCATL